MDFQTRQLGETIQLYFEMSDYGDEDDMDIDAPPPSDAITFSSNDAGAKGKRSAANLPVEAEDSLPWFAFHDA